MANILDDLDTGKSVWTFGGGKGGIGRTLMTVNFGLLLAKEGRDVVIFDGAFGSANAHTALGVKRPEKTLYDIIHNRPETIDDIIIRAPMKNLRLISGGMDVHNSAYFSPGLKKDVVKRLQSVDCEFLLIDLGGGTCCSSIEFFVEGNTGVLVTTPDPAAIELLYGYMRAVFYRRLRKIIDKPSLESHVDEIALAGMTGNLISVAERVAEKIAKTDQRLASKIENEIFSFDLKLIVNMTIEPQDQYIGPSVCEIVDKFYGFRMDYLGHIPFDERVALSCKRGRPFVTDFESSETAACFNMAFQHLLKSSDAGMKNHQLSLIRT